MSRSNEGRSARKSAMAVKPDPETLALSVNQVAWVLGVSPNTVWTMVGQGLLPSFVVGRRRLVSRVEVEAFISSGGKSAGGA